MKNQQVKSHRLLILPFAFSLFLEMQPITSAQIIPDATLPNNSRVIPNCTTCEITGGTTAGSNLFHSFEQFSVPTNGTAFFNNAPTIQNIITRVTGGSISKIDGLIRANGTANLFLLNPNGIIFGPNAALNIGGSFIGSTANSLKFADGSQFGAIAAQNSPLLTVSVPLGLQYGPNPGNIVVQGSGNNLALDSENFSIIRDNRPVGLQVQPGQTLALVGGNVALEGGNLTAEQGRIELGAVSGEGMVTLTATNPGWRLSYEGVGNFQDIRLSQAASVDVSGNRGGEIQVRGGRVILTDGSAMLTDTLGTEAGGNLDIRASSVEISGISANQFFSGLFTDVAPGSSGKGGNLTIETGSLRLTDGAQIGANTFGSGDAGTLTVKAQSVELIGESVQGPSGLFAAVAPGATGKGGNLTVETSRLRLTDGAQIFTGTFGSGDAGDLAVRAQDIEVVGGSAISPSALLTTVELEATGRGGNLTIDTGRLRLINGGQIAASTAGAGKAGELIVRASESIELTGTSEQGRSGLFASAIIDIGDGGNLTVTTEQLTVRNGATINVSNFSSNRNIPAGQGAAGNLNIQARSIRLEGGSTLTAEAAVGERGNISLQSENIVLRRGSGITTNAQGTATGGNITINTDTLTALEDSDITANAKNNFGGRVIINAQGIFGTQFRDRNTPISDITASSALGPQFSGVVELNTPDIDPSEGLVELPENLADPSTQVRTACENLAGNVFVVTGRGGLPEDASQTLREQTAWRDLRLPGNARVRQQGRTSDRPSPITHSPSQIIEAQGWVVDAKGQVTLVAYPTQRNPSSSWYRPANCRPFLRS